MKQLRAFLLLLILLLPMVALRAFQDTPAPRLEITSVNSSQMPAVIVSANVYDALGQPVLGLTEDNFTVTGELAGTAQITNVVNLSDDNLPFATVLMIDVSSSMEGAPMENARRAAQAFVDNIGPNDPVAIMTFGTRTRLLQDYTTDKAALSAVIANLQPGGVTALYQGAYDAIQVAANSPTPRRAVILLSDGAEYGNQSDVGRGAAAAEALARGVPIYAIGLGYNSIDRTYLQELSDATSSQFYESPLPEELTQIYTSLASKLRSQYLITLDVPLPLDGTEYTLGLEATTPQGTAEASAVLRAPIPVPILQLPDLSEPLTEPTEITATLLADDPVESVTFQINDAAPLVTPADAPTISINPVEYPPGDYLLTVSATDDTGDTGSTVIPFTIAALPSEIALVPDLAELGEIDEPVTVTVETSGQTPATRASVAFSNGESEPLGAPFGFTIDPLDFVPGENSVIVAVTNEGGVTATETFDFSIAALPPVITVVGLEDGQTVDAPVEFSIDVTAQEAVTNLNVSINEVALEPDADGAYSIDPMDYSPGATMLLVQATAANGLTSQEAVNFTIAALPPQISIDGLEAGETISEDREITPSFVSQSPVIHLAVFVDDIDLAHLVTPPFSFTLEVLDFEPGEHTLRLIADNADGESGTLEVPFSIAGEPAATATAQAVTATQRAIATATQQAVATQVAVEATQVAAVTGTQVAIVTATQQAVATQIAVEATQAAAATGTQIVQASATGAAVSTQAAVLAATQVSLDSTATQVKVEATASEAAVQATQAAQITRTAQQATANAGATATEAAAQASEEAAITRTAQQAAFSAGATATDTARDTATAVAQQTQSVRQAATDVADQTQSARQTATSVQATATQQARATEQAANLATQQAQMTATAVAQETEDAQASATQAAANMTATEMSQAQNVAQATATQSAQQTLDARATSRAQAQSAMQIATRDALATSNAEGRLAAQATQDARATRNAIATATQNARETATEQALATATIVQATQAVLDATRDAQETLSALEATATELIVNATATRHALETQTSSNATATQTALDATATEAAAELEITQAAADAQATSNAAATAQRGAQLTATAQSIADAASATANASATALANVAATDTQATSIAGATATTIAQATLDTRLTAVGPTSTQVEGGAQGAATQTPSPQPTLTEIQTGEAAASSNITPIIIVVIVILIIIIVLVLIMRGRGAPRS